MQEKNSNLALFDRAVLEEKVTWWEMNLPSALVFFGETKAKMLGFSEEKFKTYHDFMALVHKEDNEKAMQAMRDHLEGKKNFYETIYRIQNSSGEYIKFYDFGQIIEKKDNNITVIGFVMKIEDEKDTEKQREEFKKIILSGNPSILEIVSSLK